MSKLIHHRILVTAGHVDHGKSALVRALTGTNPDRLPEEKRRGISIELGFAELRLEDDDREIVTGMVDVPGHEDFVKTMTSGVSSADAALLVVAADDGPMPQTFEHMEILEYLGVRSGIIAISKGDLVADIALATATIRAALAGSPFAEWPIVAVSIHDSKSITHLKRSLIELLRQHPEPSSVNTPRLWIDRAFTSKGVGTIVAGTLVGGKLQKGQAIVLRPRGQLAHIRSLHTHHRAADRVGPQTRVAMNLPELSLAANDLSAAGRGHLVTIEGVTESSTVVDVLLLQSKFNTRQAVLDAKPVRLLIGTANVAAKIDLFVDPRFARIKFEQVLPIMLGDRFVLRSASDQFTLAGGVVLDATPPVQRRWRSHSAQLELLLRRSIGACSLSVLINTALKRDGFVDLRALRRQSTGADSELDQLIKNELNRTFVCINDSLLSIEKLRTLEAELASAVRAFHVKHPQRAGLPLSEARTLILKFAPRPLSTSDALLERLRGDGFQMIGTALRLSTFRPALPPRLAAAGDKLRTALSAGGLSPLARPQLARSDAEQEALRFLIANGEAIDLGPDVVLSSQAYSAAIVQIRKRLAEAPATVTELKSLLNSSRRIMIPLLERLDREGITRRQGDLRTLPPPR